MGCWMVDASSCDRKDVNTVIEQLLEGGLHRLCVGGCCVRYSSALYCTVLYVSTVCQIFLHVRREL